MQYQVLRLNNDLTARVKMTINDHDLEQDFPIGESQDDLDSNILKGMAIFNEELKSSTVLTENPYSPRIETAVVAEESLPVIPPEDSKPEEPVAEQVEEVVE